MSDGTSTEQATASDQASPPALEQSTAPSTPLPHTDPAAPPAIGDPLNPPAGEPVALAEVGGQAEPVQTPLPPYEPMLPTLTPTPVVFLDHALPDDEGEPGHIRVECPNCGSLWQGNDLRPHAEWFCGTCDFPLFWARSGVPGSSDVDSAFARLPGTDGRDAMVSLACPTCGEQNPPVPSANCLRCGSPLTPPVAVMALAPPSPIMIVAPEIVPRRRIWPWVVATCVLATALIVAVVIAVNRR